MFLSRYTSSFNCVLWNAFSIINKLHFSLILFSGPHWDMLPPDDTTSITALSNTGYIFSHDILWPPHQSLERGGGVLVASHCHFQTLLLPPSLSSLSSSEVHDIQIDHLIQILVARFICQLSRILSLLFKWVHCQAHSLFLCPNFYSHSRELQHTYWHSIKYHNFPIPQPSQFP